MPDRNNSACCGNGASCLLMATVVKIMISGTYASNVITGLVRLKASSNGLRKRRPEPLTNTFCIVFWFCGGNIIVADNLKNDRM